SKTLLHLAQVVEEAGESKDLGVSFGEPKIDLDAIRTHKKGVVEKLTSGLDALCKARKVERIVGNATFVSDTQLLVKSDKEETQYTFDNLIIATGSRPVQIPGIDYEDKRIWDSTTALELTEIPKKLLIIGGGIIGLEMASIYHALGSSITIVEMTDSLIPPADRDIKQPLVKKIKNSYEAIYTSTKVVKVEGTKNQLIITLDGKKAPQKVEADAVLVAVGRKSNSDLLNLEKTSIKLTERNYIITDKKQRTNVANIYAIGDITGDPMLAHRAVHQGRVAAEVICGLPSAFTPISIPSVAYTNPEIAWVGLTENEAKEKNINYKKGSFPWIASGRAISSVATEGVSKVIFDTETKRIIGAAICGKNAGELISEAALALEMGAVAEDIALTIHPHPTLSEAVRVSAEEALRAALNR
ncbi:MAG: dihydrolipoyl dehydrogenase, partial [Spirochaetia bacterium]|nr:dihydrolipoyl dehydrogenase [Spirochaetia bacterium]